MSEYLSEQDEDELDEMLAPLDDIKIPYDLSLEELRNELKTFLPKWKNYRKSWVWKNVNYGRYAFYGKEIFLYIKINRKKWVILSIMVDRFSCDIIFAK